MPNMCNEGVADESQITREELLFEDVKLSERACCLCDCFSDGCVHILSLQLTPAHAREAARCFYLFYI